MRLAIILFCMIAAPALAQITGPRTGVPGIDTAWDICTRQSAVEFIPACTTLRRIRAKFPMQTLAPTTADFGANDLAYIETTVEKWGSVR